MRGDPTLKFTSTAVVAAFATLFAVPVVSVANTVTVTWTDNARTVPTGLSSRTRETVLEDRALRVREGTHRNSSENLHDSSQKTPSLSISTSGFTGNNFLYIAIDRLIGRGSTDRNHAIAWRGASVGFCNDPFGSDLWHIEYGDPGGSDPEDKPASTAPYEIKATTGSGEANPAVTLQMGPCPDSLSELDQTLEVNIWVSTGRPASGPDPDFRFLIYVEDDDGVDVRPPAVGAIDGLVFDAGGISINGRTPILLDEAHAEQILDVTVPYTVPRNHPGGASLDFRLYPSGAFPADLDALGDPLVCPRPQNPAENDPDVLVSESAWLTTGGGATRHVTVPNLDTQGPDGSVTPAVPEPRVAAFRFGLLCHDDRPESEESFTLEAWFSAGDDSNSKTPTSATIARITDDDSAAPGVPTQVEAFIDPSPSPGAPAVVWEPPTGVLPVVTRYDVQWRDSVNRRWSNSHVINDGRVRSHRHTGTSFVPGRVYTARVRAGSASAWGSWSAEASVMFPAGLVPGEPVGLAVGVSGGELSARWTVPSTPVGVVVTGHHVQWRSDDQVFWQPRTPYVLAADADTHDYPRDFEPGRDYEVRVRAFSVHGSGPWASASYTVPVDPVVGVPSDVEAFYDVNAAAPAIRWAAPVNSPVEVVGYDVQWRDDVNRRWSTVHKLGDVRSHVHQGLTFRPGGVYSGRVRARSASGEGVWSEEVSVTVPLDPVVGVPTDIEAFIDVRRKAPAVRWAPPEDSDADPVGYDVQWRDDVNRRWSSVHQLGDVRSHVHQGLSFRPGGVYSARVRARSSTGPGAWSAEVSVTFPETLMPGVPINVEAFLDGSTPAVTWEPPVAVAGVTVTGYVIQYRTTADRVWRDPSCRMADLRELKCRAPSAIVLQTYEFRVRATSANGDGPWSASVTVTVPESPLPGVPTAVEAFLDSGVPAVTWEPPVPIRGALVTGYKVQYRTSANRVWIDAPGCVSLPATARVCALTSVVPGETYEFRVQALSAEGAGPWSAAASVEVPAVPVPAAPQGLRLEADGLALVATWDEPANVEEAPVEGYRLRLRGTGIDDRWYERNTAASQLRLRIANLPFERGGTYRAQVRAVGIGGDGPWSAEAQAEIPEAVVPGLPAFGPPRLSGGGVLLSWSAPANAALARVVRYELSAWLTARAEPSASADVAVTGRTDHTVTTIGPGCEFRARVRAVGQHGAGGYARLDPTVLGAGDCEAMRPTAPTSVSATLADRLATVRWTRGAGDIEVVAFEIEADPESGAGEPFTQSVGVSSTSWTSPTLLVGDWRFRVRARGRSLTSAWSSWSNTVKVGGTALATVSFDPEATAIVEATHNPAVLVVSQPLAIETTVVIDSPRRLYVSQLLADGRSGYEGQGRTPYVVTIAPGVTRVDLLIEPEDPYLDPFRPGQQVDYHLRSPSPPGDLGLGYPSSVSCVVAQPRCFQATVPTLPGWAFVFLAGALVILGSDRFRRRR